MWLQEQIRGEVTHLLTPQSLSTMVKMMFSITWVAESVSQFCGVGYDSAGGGGWGRVVGIWVSTYLV